MSFHNPRLPWSELERVLSGRSTGGKGSDGGKGSGAERHLHVVDPLAVDADGGDSPAWSRRREHYRPPELARPDGVPPYAELHAHTNFSFLDGASHPEELAEEAVRLGLTALAVTDHDGFYGVVRFAEAPARWACRRSSERNCPSACPVRRTAYPTRTATTCCCWLTATRGTPGWPRPSPAPSCGAVRRAARSTVSWRRSPPTCATTCWCSPAAARGTCRPPAHRGGRRGGPRAGPAHRAVWRGDGGGGADRPRHPVDGDRNDALAELATAAGLPTVATNNVHYATPGRRRLATTLAAVRSSVPSWPSTSSSWRRSCRRTRCRRGTPR